VDQELVARAVEVVSAVGQVAQVAEEELAVGQDLAEALAAGLAQGQKSRASG
jgi:hypothetical protein